MREAVRVWRGVREEVREEVKGRFDGVGDRYALDGNRKDADRCVV